jgi:hypothetical protein
VGDRKWKINKFDAMTGSFIAMKMVSKLSNVVAGVVSGVITDSTVIGVTIANEIGQMSKQEFMDISGECLAVVKEIHVVGDKETENPLRLPDGRWSVPEIEHDSLLISALVGHVLLFNLSGFFEGNALKDARDSFSGLIPFSAKTSTDTAGLRS